MTACINWFVNSFVQAHIIIQIMQNIRLEKTLWRLKSLIANTDHFTIWQVVVGSVWWSNRRFWIIHDIVLRDKAEPLFDSFCNRSLNEQATLLRWNFRSEHLTVKQVFSDGLSRSHALSNSIWDISTLVNWNRIIGSITTVENQSSHFSIVEYR